VKLQGNICFVVSVLLCTYLFSSPYSFASKAEKKTAAKIEKNISLDSGEKIEDKSFSSGWNSLETISSYSGIALFILLVLSFLSLFSWAMILFKWFSLRRAEKNCKDFLLEFSAASSLDSLYKSLDKYPDSPAKEIFSFAYQDFMNFNNNFKKDSRSSYQMFCEIVLDHFSRSLHKIKIREKINLEKFLAFLAITASTAPFIGLLGTVCGIISAFDAIALSGSNSLSAVAPGLSEALVATAFGLVAAIPAVVGYNWSNSKIRSILSISEALMSDFVSIVQRYLLAKNEDS
jgi:biopolymer transport protein TolQ